MVFTLACLILPGTTSNMTTSEKSLLPTAPDDDESDWDDVGGGDDEKSRLLRSPDSSRSSSRASSPEPTTDPHFSPPPPSPLKHFYLLAFVVLLLWVGYQMRSGLLEAKKKPKVIHASRLVHQSTAMLGWNGNNPLSLLDTRKSTNSALLRAQLSRRRLKTGGCV